MLKLSFNSKVKNPIFPLFQPLLTLFQPFEVLLNKNKIYLLYWVAERSLNMKINCHVDPNLKEEHGELWLRKITPEINDFLQKLAQSDDAIWCHYQSQIIPVKYQDIYALEVANRDISVFTEKQQLSYNDRLSNLKTNLPSYFIEASRSAVFNYQHIDHLEILDNGLIDVVLTNNHRVQISRRNIKNLKERLGI